MTTKPVSPSIVTAARPWIGRASAVLIGLLAGWLMVEVLIRLIAPRLPINVQLFLQFVHVTPFSDATIVRPSILRQDNYFGMIARPGVVDEWQVANAAVRVRVTTINWLDPNSHVGFRVDSPDWQPRWPVDVAAIGDSFTWCVTEWEDCWVERLSIEHGLSVVNLGASGTGTTGQLRLFQTFGLPYQPRIVVWQWYANDINDDYWLRVVSGEIVLPENVFQERPVASSPLGRWLQDNSAVYTIIEGLTRERDPGFVDRYSVSSGEVSLNFGAPHVLAASDMTRPENQQGWQYSQEAFTAMRDLLAENNIALVIVLIPAKEEVYAHLTADTLGAEQIAALDDGRRLVLDLCAREGLACLDMTPILTEHALAGEQIYWPTDLHLNVEGNRILAGAVWTFLAEQGLVGE